MQAPNPAALPVEQIPIPVAQPAVSPSFVSTALDLTDGWGRRRLLAVIATAGAAENAIALSALTGRIERLFLTNAMSDLDRTFDALVDVVTISDLADLTFAFALIAGTDITLAAKSPAQGMLQQDGERTVFPFEADGDEGLSLFRAELLEGDLLALVIADPDQETFALVSIDSAESLDDAIGQVWFCNLV